MPYPVAENHKPAGGAQGLVDGHVSVPENEVIDVGVDVAEVLTGEDCLWLGVHAAEYGFGAMPEVAVGCAPPMCEAYRPSRMYGGVEHLAEAVTEEFLYNSESERTLADLIAVGEIEFFAVDFAD